VPGEGVDTSPPAILLSELKPGGEARLVTLNGPRRRARRLAELGLTPGVILCVLQVTPGQPLLIRVRNSSLAIDYRLAQDVYVEPLPEKPVKPPRTPEGWLRRCRKVRARPGDGKAQRCGGDRHGS
jgi:Fe2+ transport system protein FeoA